jgi:hypothetical protein
MKSFAAQSIAASPTNQAHARPALHVELDDLDLVLT